MIGTEVFEPGRATLVFVQEAGRGRGGSIERLLRWQSRLAERMPT